VHRAPAAAYFDTTGRDDVLTGGIKMIEITTPKGPFKVWTKRIGNNPKIKVLMLHGGPGLTHEAFEAFNSYFPAAGIEYYFYDQLGSFYSDQPDEPELWTIPRFVDEVEQVRQALKLDKDNFYLLAGLIISNMNSSISVYNKYATDVLMPTMNQQALAEIQRFEEKGETNNPRYMELLMREHYSKYLLRMPPEQWPDPVLRPLKHMNPKIYVPLGGPSELMVTGSIKHWDRTADLGRITVPTLTIGARYDTMDPKNMEWMAKAVKNGRFLYCADGSHLSMYDDQRTYMTGLIAFLRSASERPQ
jgi:proline iminopeptidase